MTLDFSNQPAQFNLNQVATADTVDFFQGTSKFGNHPKTTKVRDASLFRTNFSPKQQTLVNSTDDFGKPIFRRRRDYSQGASVKKPRAGSKPKSSRVSAPARNRTSTSRQNQTTVGMKP